MDDEFGLEDDGQPRGPFHPADLVVTVAVFFKQLCLTAANLFGNLQFDAQRHADYNRDRRVMAKETMADIRSLR